MEPSINWNFNMFKLESLHKALNTLTASSKNIYKRTNIVISKLEDMINNFEVNSRRQAVKGTLTPNGSFSMGMIQKVGTSFNHVGGFQ